jgi:hypothetical protein
MTLTVFQVGVDLENAQLLDTQAADVGTLYARPADGESVAGRPWPATLKLFDPSKPRASFFYLHESFLVMDAATADLCRPALRCGELIRFSVTEIGHVYLYNPTITLRMDAVDWSATRGKYGVYSNLTLMKEMIPPNLVFRLPKMSNLYLSSHLQDDEQDLLYLYQKHKLSGLYFKKLWDEQAGAVPNRSTQPGTDN